MKLKIPKETVLRLKETIKKYQYVGLVLLIGLVLLVIPTRQTSDKGPSAAPEAVMEIPGMTMEERLEDLLSQIENAGKIRVMLTVRAGEYTVYQTDQVTEETTKDGMEDRSVSITTVFSETKESGEEGIPVQVIGPEYLGAVVVAEGADLATVRLNLMHAVSSLTGLGADKITVVKMKSN